MNTVDRFTAKTDFYAAHRWDYEPAAIDVLVQIADLQPGDAVADVGAGTGAVTRHLLARGLHVTAVEPNATMRRIAELQLSHDAHFVSVAGLSDATGLADKSVALITVGRAIHWFPAASTRREFLRILRPGGWLALLGVAHADPELAAAVRALQTAENGWDVAEGKLSRAPVDMRSLYCGEHFQELGFPGIRRESWAQFLGRLLSFSSAPDEGSTYSVRFAQAARAVFDRFATDGVLTVVVTTELTIGVLCNHD